MAEVKKPIEIKVVKTKIIEKPKVVVMEKAPEPVLKLAPKIERQPAATQQAQSVLKLGPSNTLGNLRFTDSYVDMHVTQGFLASNKQFEASNPYSQSYNLGFDVLHWSYNHGVKAEITKSAVSSSSKNSILLAELNYMYRIFVASKMADGDRIQLVAIAGYEMYQNSNSTTDFVSSYSLFKMGLGASFPLFRFWNAETDLMYGMGTSKSSSLQFNARLNYYWRPNLSLGLGFQARKYDYVLLDLKNVESFTETFTSVRYHY